MMTNEASANKRSQETKVSYKDFPIQEFVEEYERAKEVIDSLRRCTRCVLPETFPFINFDEDGVCNYCHHYAKMNPRGVDALRDAFNLHQKADGSVKCVVSFSGGRDSSYTLHYVSRVLGLDTIAFTYDWGVVPDLAHRNQKRMCEQLGVEQIVITANLQKKYDHIRANLEAWLKKPNLGTIPLLTGVGHQFFYLVHRVAKRTDRQPIVIGATPMETTYFKTGFSGIEPEFDHSKRVLERKFKLAFSYLDSYLKNPAYINRSLWDTLTGYISISFVPRNFVRLFEYIRWDENEVNNTLINDYGWETSDETANTWRIDDGTVPMSDYMYYIMSGLTINDTFRSNQIREGEITREEALEILDIENAPRFNGIQWYCGKIGADFEKSLRIVNQAPRLYM
jgi:hypothetical protein